MNRKARSWSDRRHRFLTFLLGVHILNLNMGKRVVGGFHVADDGRRNR